MLNKQALFANTNTNSYLLCLGQYLLRETKASHIQCTDNIYLSVQGVVALKWSWRDHEQALFQR